MTNQSILSDAEIFLHSNVVSEFVVFISQCLWIASLQLNILKQFLKYDVNVEFFAITFKNTVEEMHSHKSVSFGIEK